MWLLWWHVTICLVCDCMACDYLYGMWLCVACDYLYHMLLFPLQVPETRTVIFTWAKFLGFASLKQWTLSRAHTTLPQWLKAHTTLPPTPHCHNGLKPTPHCHNPHHHCHKGLYIIRLDEMRWDETAMGKLWGNHGRIVNPVFPLLPMAAPVHTGEIVTNEMSWILLQS